jgi:hypothetical protein
MFRVFGDFDVEQFWKPSEYAEKKYVGVPLTDERVAYTFQEDEPRTLMGWTRSATE